MSSSVAALCRLDESWVERIERSDRLGGLALRALAVIAVGAGAYGWVFGCWRGDAQALYAAVKLPLLFVLVAGIASLASAMLGAMLGARLSLAQTVVCVLASLAIASTILGALAPISFFLVAHADAPSLAPSSLSVAQAILIWHVVLIGLAGWTGLTKLGALLRRLVPQPAVARRVLASWILLVGASGAELSWLLRPFLGKPHLPESFFRQEALQGSFFEEVGQILERVLGASGAFVWVAIALVMLLAWSRSAVNRARLRVVEGGIELDLGRTDPLRVPFAELAAARAVGAELHVRRVDAKSLLHEVYVVDLGDAPAAEKLAAELEGLRMLPASGPFRT